jgi:pantoate--beta-alanine ligase
MILVETAEALKLTIDQQLAAGETIGFVPTMGALHQGHLSLVTQAAMETGFVAVSIFVNPTQFNDPEDLKKYPRDLETDMNLLEGTGCDLVFAPTVEVMYPKPDTRVFEFGGLGNVMEGEFRPGHFNGVAQVVSKLFDMVNPHKSYFGLKDFQQLAIIKQMVKQLNYNIEIVPCVIVREPDGLAMSSRNVRLSAEERISAALISKTLFEAVEKAKHASIDEVKKWVVETIDKNPHLKTEYFDIVDDDELMSLTWWNDKSNKTGCIAVMCGNVRLIDNVSFT